MSSVSEIVAAFSPLLEQMRSRIEANQITPMDLRVINLVKTLQNCQNARGSSAFDNFEVVNTHLSHSLTLSDFKIFLEYNSKAADLVVTYLKLQQNFDKINPTFSVIERIQNVSESILKHVSLFYLQLTGFVLPLENSPVWYALATDDKFLNRQVRKLKDTHSPVEVITAKIKDIEIRNPDLLNSYRDVPFKAPLIFGSLELTLGKLRLLSGEEINSIASKLPPSVGSLFTYNQITSLNFNLFSGELLDKIIGGDGTDEEISRRLGTLNADQIEIFLKKSSGCHFSKFSDSFYQVLPLSRLSENQVEALFNDDYGRQTEKAIRHLHLVSSQEISKGFHLLPEKLSRMLSEPQLAFLDYSKMSENQVYSLFSPHHYKNKEEHKKRVQLIPLRFVNDVIKISNSYIIESLSKDQYGVVNTASLDQKTVQNLFPGFAIETLHPGYTYTVRDGGVYGMRHEFKLETHGSSSLHGYSKKELEDKISENKARCIIMARNFSAEQLLTMIPLMHPECKPLNFF